MSAITFGRFKGICEMSPLPLCRLVESKFASGPTCYARSIDANFIVFFQPASLTIHFISVIMTLVMIFHVRTKYIALGRKEIINFFYLYLLQIILDMVVVSGIVRDYTPAYMFLVAIHLALISATIFCLFFNGFVGFQFVEDGTRFSVWMVRLLSFAAFAVTFLISVGTFQSIIFTSNNPIVLWVWLYLVHGVAILIYALLQIILVVKTSDDFWPIGNIILGLLFFVLGQVILNILSSRICEGMVHYVDGMIFSTILTLLSVMMIYKYWDSFTKEDLEFSLSNTRHQWEVKDLEYERERLNDVGQNTYGRSSHYHRTSKQAF